MTSTLRRSNACARAATTTLALAVAMATSVLLAHGPAIAADTPPAPPAARLADCEPLARARACLKAQDYQGALVELRCTPLPGDADWNNLIGFALRKQGAPDLAAAERHYEEASRLKPQHLGALEYSGELYLARGDLARAEQRLAALAAACGSCEQQVKLQRAIDEHKAAKVKS